MFLELFVFIVILFFIAVIFYKQSTDHFEILQLEAERISELPDLYEDKSPIVIRGFQMPNLGTYSELQKRPHILQMAVAPKTSLQALLTDQKRLQNFILNPETAKFLAKETGLQTWFEHHLFTQLLPSEYTKFLFSFKTFLYPEHRGLFKTTAYQTLIAPTQGIAKVNVMLSKMLPYLPNKWQGRRFDALSTRDTPLLNQIQFVEIKVKKGNLLLLPPHLIVDVASVEDAWIFIGEIHNPISLLI